MNRHLTIASSLIAILLLLVVAVAGLPSNSQAAVAEPPAADADSTAGPAAPAAVTAGSYPGLYYMDYYFRNPNSYYLNPAVYPVDGAMMFTGWSELNPGKNSYDWALLDNWAAARKSQACAQPSS